MPKGPPLAFPVSSRSRPSGSAAVWSMPLCRVLWFFSINYFRKKGPVHYTQCPDYVHEPHAAPGRELGADHTGTAGGAAGARRGRGPARAWPTAGRRGEVTGVGCVQRRSEEALSGRGLLERALVTWGRRRCSCSSLARPSGRRRRRRRAMRSAAAAAAAARACSGSRAALC